jgi:hypothetical protein
MTTKPNDADEPDRFNAPITLAAGDVRQLLEAAEEFLTCDVLGVESAEQLRAVVQRVNAVTPREYGCP